MMTRLRSTMFRQRARALLDEVGLISGVSGGGDKSDRVPSTSQVLDSLVFGAGERLTTETTAMMNDVAQRLSGELQAARNLPGSPVAADAEIHVINVSLHDLHDASLRHAVLRVPTALTILPGQVRELRAAGRMALRESAAFQQLRRSLDASAGATAFQASFEPAAQRSGDARALVDR